MALVHKKTDIFSDRIEHFTTKALFNIILRILLWRGKLNEYVSVPILFFTRSIIIFDKISNVCQYTIIFQIRWGFCFLALLFQVGVALAKKDKARDLSLSQIHFRPVFFSTTIWLAMFAGINLDYFNGMLCQYSQTTFRAKKLEIFLSNIFLFQEHGQFFPKWTNLFSFALEMLWKKWICFGNTGHPFHPPWCKDPRPRHQWSSWLPARDFPLGTSHPSVGMWYRFTNGFWYWCDSGSI